MNPERNRRHVRELRARRLKANRAIVLAEKRKGCSCCPKKDLPPELIHFDHLDKKTKVACISDMMRWSTPRVVAEINKTRRICVECHRKRHRWEHRLERETKGGANAN